MANCYFCTQEVGMPYSCKLCGLKFCSKHRLPENHECTQIDIYKSPEYRRTIVRKDTELQEVSQGSAFQGRSGSEVFSITWTSGSHWIDITIIALVASIATVFSFNLFAIIGGFIFAFLSAEIILRTREYITSKGNGVMDYELFPFGIALSIISLFFSWSLLLVVKFADHMNEKARANAAIATIFSLLVVGIIPSVLRLFIPSDTILGLMVVGAIIVGRMLMITALLLFLPMYRFEGQFIFLYSRQKYFSSLISGIFLFFANLFLLG